MTRFRHLAFATTVATLVLVGVGGLVRATGSGLGCLDEWPTCFGGWIAPVEYHAMIEWGHRALAGVVGVMVVATAICARLWLPGHATLRRLSYLAVVTVVVQAAIGRWVVVEHLHAQLVTAHFLVAAALVAILVALVLGSSVTDRPAPDPAQRKTGSMAVGAAVGTLLVMVAGTLVRERGAGLVFQDWPLMDGRLLPSFEHSATLIHFSHRVLAAVVMGHLLATALRARRDRRPDVRSLAWWSAGLYGAQVLLGGINVLTDLAPWAVMTHVALGVLTWAAVFGLVVVSRAGSPVTTGSHDDGVVPTTQESR